MRGGGPIIRSYARIPSTEKGRRRNKRGGEEGAEQRSYSRSARFFLERRNEETMGFSCTTGSSPVAA